MCNGYRINGEEKNFVPFQMNKVDIEPCKKTFKGWMKDISEITEYDNLPIEMKSYIQYLNSYLGVPVKYISNGPGRDQLLHA